ncbi:CocE/NonD family hydrolase [Nocardia sp. NPDC050630]|uniref:CocE/NonD family hydrolase n=1 Tax=Nocardia sp. NPDC050630 TaxID=3364321 RepID=UPI00378A2FF6
MSTPARATWRRLAAVVVLAASVASAGCGSREAPPGTEQGDTAALPNYQRPEHYKVHRTADLLVPMRDGYRLTCDLYRPGQEGGAPRAGRFPGIVGDYTGYGRRLGERTASWLAARGYNVIVCNTRGAQGGNGASPAPESTGPLFPWQPQEQEDDYDLIEWLAAQQWSTGKVGQYGGSYGAITSWLVAGRQKPPHLAAIVPMMGARTSTPSSRTPGGIRTNEGDARGQWTQACSQATGEPTCSDRMTALWAAHPVYDRFWEQQTVDLEVYTVPTLAIAGLQDFFTNGADGAYKELAERDDFRVLYGPWNHVGVPVNGVAFNPQGIVLAWLADR